MATNHHDTGYKELGLRQTPLSGVFGVENAGHSWEALQQAVNRVVAIIQSDPNKERTDRILPAGSNGI